MGFIFNPLIYCISHDQNLSFIAHKWLDQRSDIWLFLESPLVSFYSFFFFSFVDFVLFSFYISETKSRHFSSVLPKLIIGIEMLAHMSHFPDSETIDS